MENTQFIAIALVLFSRVRFRVLWADDVEAERLFNNLLIGEELAYFQIRKINLFNNWLQVDTCCSGKSPSSSKKLLIALVMQTPVPPTHYVIDSDLL